MLGNVHVDLKLCWTTVCAASHYTGHMGWNASGAQVHLLMNSMIDHSCHLQPNMERDTQSETFSSSHQPHLLLFRQVAVNICPLGGLAEITYAVQIQQLSVLLWPSPYIDLFCWAAASHSPWAADSEPFWEGGSSQGAGGHWLQAPQLSSCVPFCLRESPPVLVPLMLPHILLILEAAKVPTVCGSMCCKMHTTLRSSLSQLPYWFSPN